MEGMNVREYDPVKVLRRKVQFCRNKRTNYLFSSLRSFTFFIHGKEMEQDVKFIWTRCICMTAVWRFSIPCSWSSVWQRTYWIFMLLVDCFAWFILLVVQVFASLKTIIEIWPGQEPAIDIWRGEKFSGRDPSFLNYVQLFSTLSKIFSAYNGKKCL